MRTTTRRYYDQLLVAERTVGLTREEARNDLDRAFRTFRMETLN